MELTTYVYIVAGAALFSLIGRQVIYSLLQWWKLRSFPGPPSAGFSWIWLGYVSLSGRAYQLHNAARERYAKLSPSSSTTRLEPGAQDGPHAAYFPLMRIAPTMLITDSPAVMRQINGARSGYTRSEWYSTMRFDPYVDTMLSSRDVGYHDDAKFRTSAGYSGKEVPTLERDVETQIEALKALIRRKYLSDKTGTRPVDMAKMAQFFTLDSLTTVAYGKAWGFLTEDTDVHGYIKLVEDMSPVVALSSDVPFVGGILSSKFMLNNFGPKPTDKEGAGVMLGVAQKVVSDRFGPDAKDQPDMLGSFVRHGLPQRQCEAEVTLQIIAGSDTTANVIRVVLLFLATNPPAYRRLQSDIDAAIASGAVSTPALASEGKAMPYLQAVIYESMRCHPSAFTLNPKVVPPQGDTFFSQPNAEGLRPVFVPGGTRIGVNQWALMRHVPTFGSDVEVWRPERWLEASTAPGSADGTGVGEGLSKRAEMERTVELLFGWGRFMCAGKTFAFMELNKVFIELLRDFDFQIVNSKTPWREEQYTIFLINDMWMRVTAREK